MKGILKKYLNNKKGLGTVELVVIIAVLLGVALIFRTQIFGFVDQIFVKIFNDAGSVIVAPTPSAKLLPTP